MASNSDQVLRPCFLWTCLVLRIRRGEGGRGEAGWAFMVARGVGQGTHLTHHYHRSLSDTPYHHSSYILIIQTLFCHPERQLLSHCHHPEHLWCRRRRWSSIAITVTIPSISYKTALLGLLPIQHPAHIAGTRQTIDRID